jgi:lipoprotein-anchoring transpeptidase ErfK/SrfK
MNVKKQNQQKRKPKQTRKKPAAPKIAPVVQPQPPAPALFAWRRRTILVATAIVTAALLWLGGNMLYSRTSVGTTVVSSDLSNSQLETLVASRAAAYRLTLQYPNGRTRVFSLHELGVYTNAAASVSVLRKEQRTPLHWLAWWRPVPVQLSARIDDATLRAFIADHATLVTQPAKNATIALANGKVVVTPGADGRQYGFTNATRTILAAARSLQAAPLQLTTIAREPDISVRTLAPTKAQLERILHQNIHITIGDQTVTPPAPKIASWLTLTPAGDTVTVGLDQYELRGYFAGLADEHTKDARSRVISDVTGEVLVNGSNGSKVQNTVEVNDALAGKILDATGATLSLSTTATAFKTVHAPTAGKWFEVDTTTKRMYAYDQGEVVRSFLVSAGAPGTPTVTGRFAIYAKYTSQDMSGTNADGSRYFQPNVPYVNYFYHDFAIHGNYWRPGSYFGYINSSHGCVGVTVNEGAWIYSWAPVGTPVIIHT